jgi:hypothetical protein
MIIFIALFLFSNLNLAFSLGEEKLRSLLQKEHLNPITLIEDPYAVADADDNNSAAVCAIKYKNVDQISYFTKTYENLAAAQGDNAHLTHMGECGTCSSLQDLAVYLDKPDLTEPGRRCAMLSWFEPLSVRCFEKMGFSHPCAMTWFYNARNTFKECFITCVAAYLQGEPSNLPDGSLSRCLACDQEKSGKGFEKTAGRTRRNSGIVSSIRRPEREIAHITHDYF